MMINMEAFKGRADLGAQDAVFVGFRGGAEARVEIRRGVLGGEHTRISRGSNRFIALRKLSQGIGLARRNAATWDRACTPASVRPEPSTWTGAPSISARTASKVP